MPSPILHTAAGLSLARLALREKLTVPAAAVFVVLANIPDVDFIPGLLKGDPVRHHHEFTHSVACAALLAAGAWAVLKKRLPWGWLLATALSHLLLDLFSSEPFTGPTNGFRGLPLLAPLSWTRFRALPVLEGAYISRDPREWFNAHNVRSFGVEAIRAAVLLGCVWWASAPAKASGPRTTSVRPRPSASS